MQPTQEQIGIGYRQRTAFAITRRTGMSSCGFRTNVEDLVSVGQNRASTRSHRIDIELWHLDGDAGGGRLKDMLILSTET